MKISHFAKPDVQRSQNKHTHSLEDRDRSGLGALYPTAKTYEQRQRDEERRRQNKINKQPKLTLLKIAFFGAVVFGVSIMFWHQIETQWLSGSIAAIFFTFLLALMIFGLTLWWIKYTNTIFAFLGKSTYLFWIICSIAAVVELSVGLSGALTTDPTMSVFILAVIFFCIVYLLERIVLKRRSLR
jgi:hypothetical protein